MLISGEHHANSHRLEVLGILPVNFAARGLQFMRDVLSRRTSNHWVEIRGNEMRCGFVFIVVGPARVWEAWVVFEILDSTDIVSLRCSGRIVQGDGTDDLLRAVISQQSRHIQIDLSRVTAIDAAGLGVLAQLAQWARDGNRSIELVNPSRRVRSALETTRLSSVLPIRSTIRSRGEAA